MNIKNKNGVTITVLVITILVMLILFGITVTTSTDLLKNTQRNKMKTMLYMVESRAEILLNNYLFETDESNLTSGNQAILAGENADSSDIQKVGYTAGTDVVYRKWNETTLKEQGIDTKNLAQGDTIIVKYDLKNSVVDVASVKGATKNGRGIHALSEF